MCFTFSVDYLSLILIHQEIIYNYLFYLLAGPDDSSAPTGLSSEMTVEETKPVKRPVGRPKKRPHHSVQGKLVPVHLDFHDMKSVKLEMW